MADEGICAVSRPSGFFHVAGGHTFSYKSGHMRRSRIAMWLWNSQKRASGKAYVAYGSMDGVPDVVEHCEYSLSSILRLECVSSIFKRL